jgi:hypothetical protein
MRMGIFFRAIVLLFATAEAGAGQYLDADNVSQAAGMVLAGRENMLRMRAFCAEQLPVHARIIDRAALVWIDKHEDELNGAESVMSAEKVSKFLQASAPMLDQFLAESKRVAREKGVESTCLNLAGGWQSDERSLAVQSPKASKFLKEYLKAHPLGEERLYQIGDETGCRQQQWNVGNGLDSALPLCKCLTDKTYELLSTEQLKGMRQWVLAGKPLAEYEPFAKTAPDMAQCFQ